MMGTIYRQADCVYVSLGLCEFPCKQPFQQLEAYNEILETKDAAQLETNMAPRWAKLKANPMFGRCHAIFGAIARCAYWNRVWIVQEFALAGKLVVLYGDGSMSWDTLIFFSRQSWAYGYQDFQDVEATAATRDSTVLDDGRSPLEKILRGFMPRRTSEPVDRLFGALSMVDWQTGSPIKADYSLSCAQLAAKAMPHLVSNDMSVPTQISTSAVKTLLQALSITKNNTEMRRLPREAFTDYTFTISPFAHHSVKFNRSTFIDWGSSIGRPYLSNSASLNEHDFLKFLMKVVRNKVCKQGIALDDDLVDFWLRVATVGMPAPHYIISVSLTWMVSRQLVLTADDMPMYVTDEQLLVLVWMSEYRPWEQDTEKVGSKHRRHV